MRGGGASPDGWPAWATMPVEIVPPDPAWPEEAQRYLAALEPVLRPVAVGPIEHVGSTAVPGLAAKPIVDLLALVTVIEDADELARRALPGAGWEPIPQELDARPWRRAWVLPDGAVRRAHLHLVAHDHTRAAETVRFRDALREDADLRRRYELLKRELAARHRHDREAYSEAKTAFVAAALRASDGST